VSVDVPQDVRASLSGSVAPIREGLRGRWVPPENWHVTMKFLGSTWPRLLEWVIDSCRSVASRHEGFRSRLTGLGAFPNARRARVLWAGLDDPGGRMAAVAASLEDALAAEFKPEKRAFTAHLTVARFDPAVSVVEELDAVKVSSEPFPVDRLVLYRSHLQRPAPRYEPLEEFPLGGR
jgi:2'-5' RNA ligase